MLMRSWMHEPCEMCAQVIQDWEAAEYERSTDAVEAAIKAAVQDALSETRNAGRTAFSAYSRARPDRVSAVLGSVDAGLRQKLKEGLQEGETSQSAQSQGRMEQIYSHVLGVDVVLSG